MTTNATQKYNAAEKYPTIAKWMTGEALMRTGEAVSYIPRETDTRSCRARVPIAVPDEKSTIVHSNEGEIAMETETRTDTRIWGGPNINDGWENEQANIEIERADVNEIALHTFIDGHGSVLSLYWGREEAIEIAYKLLKAARLR